MTRLLKTNYLLFLPILFILLNCTQKKDNPASNPVMGSWDLIKYKDQQNDQWTEYGDSIIYQKHLSPSHFVWFKFDKKNEMLLGLGGGTYDVDTNEYTENIHFFYPPFPSLKGTSIPFEMEFKDGKWYHKGYLLDKQLDTETGKVIEVDTIKVEEIWSKTTQKDNSDLSLVKTWKMLSYRDNLNGQYVEYPDFTNFIKLITPTHFVWVKYDTQGDEIYATGAGTYTFNNHHYSESINMIFPENTGQIGEKINFEFELNDNKWFHFGYVPKLIIDSGGISKDSILIDEYWVPYLKTENQSYHF